MVRTNYRYEYEQGHRHSRASSASRVRKSGSEIYSKNCANLANDDLKQQDRLLDEFRALIFGQSNCAVPEDIQMLYCPVCRMKAAVLYQILEAVVRHAYLEIDRRTVKSKIDQEFLARTASYQSR